MKTTTNLGLKKPEGTDLVNIDDITANFDTIDTEIVKKATSTNDGRMSKDDKVKLDGLNNYTHPATHPATIITIADSNNFYSSTNVEDALQEVIYNMNMFRYVHPATHPATMIIEDTTHRFTTDAEKTTWNNKQNALSDTDVLNKIKNVDGSGSGLDTDLLDGKEGIYYKNANSITQSGQYSNAEGYNTIASGSYSHTEGDSTQANFRSSHAEGYTTIAGSPASHAEGYKTSTVSSTASNALYSKSIVTINYNSATMTQLSVISFNGTGYDKYIFDGLKVGGDLGIYAVDMNDNDIIDEYVTIIDINYNNQTVTINPINSVAGFKTVYVSGMVSASAHAEGDNTLASGHASHAEGFMTESMGSVSHAEGAYSKANSYYAHAEGYFTQANGSTSHAEGYSTKSNGMYSHAEGYYTQANGDSSHAEGYSTIASSLGSHAEGTNTTASGYYAHAEGSSTIANGYYSHAAGIANTARYCQTAIGQYSTISAAPDTTYSSTAEALIIGNGTSGSIRGNAFKVLFNGQTYADGAYASTGADYAEYFEWLDNNPDNEDRVAYFVTLDGDKIRKATSSDNYILGIISVTPSVVGDNYEAWNGKYITDEWGRVQYHDVLVPAEYNTVNHPAIKDLNGNIIKEAYDEQIEIIPERTEKQPKLNSDWNPDQEYISREFRKEWSAVGMMGKLLVRDDGTCQVNGFCKPNDEGIATTSQDGYRVMQRVSANIIKVLVK